MNILPGPVRPKTFSRQMMLLGASESALTFQAGAAYFLSVLTKESETTGSLKPNQFVGATVGAGLDAPTGKVRLRL